VVCDEHTMLLKEKSFVLIQQLATFTAPIAQ
jgi:hypothetical protein